LQQSLDPNNQPTQALNYDASGRLVSIANGSEPPTTISTNVGAQQQQILDPNGKLTTVLTYDDQGDVLERDDSFSGKILRTLYSYDAAGRPTGLTDPLNNNSSLQYDPATGNLTSMSSGGRTWSLENYNSLGEPGLIRQPDGSVQMTFSYDQKTGALLTQQQPGANPTTFSYYPNGALKSVTDPGGRTIFYGYDAIGNLATISDTLGRTIKVSIDSSGKVRTVTDQLGNQTAFDYNSDGSLKQMTDARQSQWKYGYNSLGQLNQLTDPLGNSATYLYNDLGELQQQTDRNGQLTTYAYDVDGQLIKETRPGNDISNFIYDPLGRLTTADNPSSHVDRSYDDDSQLVTETTCANTGSPANPCSAPASGNQPTVSLTYGYFGDGQVKSVSSSDPNVPTTLYTYDKLGRLASIQDGTQSPFTFGYNSLGQLNSINRPNGVVDALSYNASGDLTNRDDTVNTPNGPTVVARYDYGIDPVTGRRASMTDNSGTTNYTYYDNGWLQSATHPAGSGIANETYTYDAAGNRSSGSTTSTYDAADRIQSDGTFVYTFDGEGNLLSKTPAKGGPGTSYSWDSDHELRSITYPDGTSSAFRYDAFGRRIAATNGAQENRFVFNGLSVLGNYNSANQLQTSYVGGLESVAQGQPAYYLSDGLGSVRALTDSTGAITATYNYDSFGVPAQTNPSSPNNETFAGYQYDQTSGLYDAGARYYDPNIGRFLSEDPLTAVNPFPYAANDPTDSVDQYGAVASAEYAILLETDANAAQCIAGFVGAIAGPALLAAGAGLEGYAVNSDDVMAAIAAAMVINGAVCVANAANTNPCSFRITGWKGYPGWARRPTGWMRPINGAEYDAARAAANSTNRGIRRSAGGALKGYDIHEWQPVKFGGSPTDLGNKSAIPEAMHSEVTSWWYGLQLYLQALGCY
jgi:RHS repeat-associated protein